MAKRLRIGVDARFLGAKGGFGIGVYTQELLAALRRVDRQNHYLILVRQEALSEVPLAPNFEAVVANFPHYSLSEQLFYPHFLRALNLDLIHFTNFNAPVLFRLPPSVVTVHDLTLLFYPSRSRRGALVQWGYRYVLENALRRASRIITISQYVKQDIIRHLKMPADKIDVVYEGVSSRFRRLTDKAQLQKTLRRYGLANKFILYVGQWRRHKNLAGLIKAFAFLKKKAKLPHDLVLAGRIDPNFPEVPRLIKRLGLEKEVVLTGFVPNGDLPTLYSGADLFVFPSFHEGFGIPPLEALACGTPVAAARSSSLPEVLGEAALFFDPADPTDAAGVIHKLLTSFTLRRELIQKGLRWVKRYSYRKMAEQTFRIYRKVLKSAGRKVY